MIFNKDDLKHLIKNTYFDYKLMGVGIVVAHIKDYLFGGGQTCNKHDKYHCKKCKPKRFTYKPDFKLGSSLQRKLGVGSSTST